MCCAACFPANVSNQIQKIRLIGYLNFPKDFPNVPKKLIIKYINIHETIYMFTKH